MERAAILSDGDRLRAKDCLLYPIEASKDEQERRYRLPLRRAQQEFVRDYLQFLWNRYNGDTNKMAKAAGIHVTNVRRKLRTLGISRR